MGCSSSLNGKLTIQEVIREVGADVNTIPGYCTCPFCGDDMYVSNLPEMGGGWYQCSRCDMVGDSLTLLSRFHKIEIRDFLRSRMLMNADIFSPDNIDEHLKMSNKRKEIVAGWTKFSSGRRYQELTDYQLRDLLVQMRLMNAFASPNWKRGAGLLFGIANNGEMSHHFPVVLNEGRSNTPWLIFPLFSAPSCMTGIVLTNGTPIHSEAWFSHPKDGLTFLHRPIKSKFIVASPSQTHVAALHIMAQNSQASYPPPVVGFSDDALAVWDHLEAEKIILWGPQQNVKLFTAARRIGDRAHIATAPVFSDNDMNRAPIESFAGHSVNSVLSTMDSTSQPWLAALKDYVISRTNSHNVGRLPEKIALSPMEIEKIHSFCRNDEEARIFDNVYRGGTIDVSLSLPSGKKILQRPDGWYRIMPKGEPTLLSSAIPIIDTVIAYPDKNILSGYVKVGHPDPTQVVTAPFRVPEKEFNINWLRDFCNRTCKKFAHITSTINRDLYDLATRMHQPKVVVGVNKLGWDGETNAFVLPKRTYRRHGGSSLEECLVHTPHPYETLPDPTDIDQPSSGSFREIGPSGWIPFLVGLHHTIAPVFGADKTPVIIECPTPDMANKVTRMAAKSLWVPYAGSPSLSLLETHLEHHDLPVFCHAENDSGLNACVRHHRPANLVVVAHAGLDFELPDLLGWGRVKVPEGALEWPALRSAFPLLLHYMFESDWSAPVAANPMLWVADLVRKWLRFSLELQHEFSNDVVTAWKQPESSGRRMVNLIHRLIDNQFLGLKVQKFAAGLDKDSVIKTNDTLLVPARGLRRAAAEANIPLPPSDKITQRLKESGSLIAEISPLGQLAGWEISDNG